MQLARHESFCQACWCWPHLTLQSPLPAGPPLPSVSQLEQAGVQHVVDAEAAGQLQSRHPYIYASAADLRVADVEALLTAYKQLVAFPSFALLRSLQASTWP